MSQWSDIDMTSFDMSNREHVEYINHIYIDNVIKHLNISKYNVSCPHFYIDFFGKEVDLILLLNNQY